MNRDPHDLGDLMGRVQEAYRMRQGNRLSSSQDKALRDLAACRTAAMGGHRYRCAECDTSFWVYHACRNRACPACHGREMREWLEARQAQLLPCGYFHLVATVPATLRGAFLADPKALYGLFMKTVAQSVMDLARQERFLGGTPGILRVLHTWTGELHYHPHVHLLVTAGGITEDGEHWRDPKNADFLLPVKALSARLRLGFSEALQKSRPALFASLPQETWTEGWNTFCKSYGRGPETVLAYLGRYVFRVALTNARIVNLDDGHITFRVKDRATQTWRLCRLNDFEFLDRFLRHVLPQGFHKVRYYGLWHHSQRLQQQALRLLRLPESPPEAAPSDIRHLAPRAELLAAGNDPAARTTDFRPTCPHCGSERLIHLEELQRGDRFTQTARPGASP